MGSGENIRDGQSEPPSKRFGRRQALKVIGSTFSGVMVGVRLPKVAAAGAAMDVPALAGRGYRPLASGTVPKALTASELTTLEHLVERILPATETPGARAAGVHWYLDDAASVEPATRAQLERGLQLLDDVARAAKGKAFAQLNEAEQDGIVLQIAGEQTRDDGEESAGSEPPARAVSASSGDDAAFFRFIKARTIDAYYKSEIGQVGELSWVGHEFHDTFPGACRHSDPLVHPRRSRAAARARTARLAPSRRT